MPKQRITKEMVVQAAFELAREGGMEQVLVKNIAGKIGCSVQPVYCYCKNMKGLKREVEAYTGEYLKRYIKKHQDPEHFFHSSGMAFAMFAKEEPNLYRLYFLRRRSKVHSLDDIYRQEADPAMAEYLSKELGIGKEEAEGLHKKMMIFNVGISFILSSLGEETNIEEILAVSKEAYQAFMKQIEERR